MVRKLKIFLKSIALSLVLILGCTMSSYGILRRIYQDSEIVERSGLIIVGHLKENSIQALSPGPYESDYHATLIVSQVLKGEYSGTEIPIAVHRGLAVIGGVFGGIGDYADYLQNGSNNHPTNQIQIADGIGAMHGRILVEDVYKDSIWFLRHGKDVYVDAYNHVCGDISGTYSLYVHDPEDMEPLILKDYYKSYLSNNPEEAVKSYVRQHPEVSWRAQRWLEKLEIARAAKIPDPQERFQKLLPYYLNNRWDARAAIISCGKVGAAGLIPIFQDPKHSDYREDIISIWHDMNYKEAAPLLIQLIKEYNQFPAKQKLDPVKNVEVYDTVRTLRTFHDPNSREAFELTKKLWVSNYAQISQECDEALKDLPKQ